MAQWETTWTNVTSGKTTVIANSADTLDAAKEAAALSVEEGFVFAGGKQLFNADDA